MLTIEQIRRATAKVKSGADFPRLAQDLIDLDVKTNDVYVYDGHAEYFGVDDSRVKTEAIYPPLEIADEGDAEKFKHQQRQADYPTFCRHSGKPALKNERSISIK